MVPAGFLLGGNTLGVGLVGGPGAEPPPGRRRIFENCKKILTRIAKMDYLSIFSQKNVKALLKIFAPLVGKHHLLGKF